MSSSSNDANAWTGSDDSLVPFTQDLSTYDEDLSSKFTTLVDAYWSKRLSVISFLVEVSTLLKHRPALVRNLNSIITTDHQLEVALEEPQQQEVALIVIKTHTRGEIHPISTQALSQESDITNSETLRNVLFWGDLKLAVSKLQPSWARCVMELLQIEISRGCDRIQPTYTKMCMRHLQSLSKRHGALPPSFLIHNVVKEGDYPVKCGGFADIWKGTFDNGKVCLKVLRFFLSASETERRCLLKRFNREALTWKRLDHPNVLPFMGVSAQLFHPTFCLIAPWMQNGNIMEFLVKNPTFDRWTALAEIVEAVRYLHEQDPPIVHADLKGANVLVSDDHHCRLADFGLSFVTESHALSSSSGTHGSLRWMAPELLVPICDSPSTRTSPSPTTSTARDIYALGCTILEIFTGQPPFHYNKIDYLVITEVTSGNRPIRPQAIADFETPFPDELWKIIQVCWAHDPRERPSAQVVLKMIREQLTSSTVEEDLINEYMTSPSLLFRQAPEEEEEGEEEGDCDIGEISPRASMVKNSIIDLYALDESDIEELNDPECRSPLAMLPQTVATIMSSEDHRLPPSTSKSKSSPEKPEIHPLKTSPAVLTRNTQHPPKSPKLTEPMEHAPSISLSPVSPATSQSSPLTTTQSPFDSPLMRDGSPLPTTSRVVYPWSEYSNSKSSVSLQPSTAAAPTSPKALKKPSFPKLDGFFSPLVTNQPKKRSRSKSALPLQQEGTDRLRPAHSRFRSVGAIGTGKAKEDEVSEPATQTHPSLLLSSDLPYISIQVARSFVPPKPMPVFLAVIQPGDDEKKEWMISKTYGELVQLDQSLRGILREDSKLHLTVPLPKERLWTDNTPNKVDLRKQQLETYLQNLIKLPINVYWEIISFLTSNIIDSAYPSLPPGYKEGYLTKRGRRFGGWKTRYFCLTGGGELKYCDWSGGSIIGSIVIGKETVIQSIEEGLACAPAGDEDEYYQHGFLIATPTSAGGDQLVGASPTVTITTTRHILCAESDEERDHWVSALLFARDMGTG